MLITNLLFRKSHRSYKAGMLPFYKGTKKTRYLHLHQLQRVSESPALYKLLRNLLGSNPRDILVPKLLDDKSLRGHREKSNRRLDAHKKGLQKKERKSNDKQGWSEKENLCFHLLRWLCTPCTTKNKGIRTAVIRRYEFASRKRNCTFETSTFKTSAAR